LVPDSFATVLIFLVLYSPTAWSEIVNTVIYDGVALILQAAQALNIPPPEGHKYNVPSGNISPNVTGDEPPPTLTSYSQAAIAGADNFMDSDVTIKDVFDVIVSTTREVTPTCRFSTVLSHRSSH
jgi:hypothetical protein